MIVRVSVCVPERSGERPRAGGGHGLRAKVGAAAQAASQGAGGAALAARTALRVYVGGVCGQVCGRGSEELCLGGPGLRGGWRHQRASHAEAAGLAGAAGAELSRAVTSAGLSMANAWKWWRAGARSVAGRISQKSRAVGDSAVAGRAG